MSLSFGFAGDDIEDDEERESLTQDLADCSISQLPTQLPAKSHDLKGLVSRNLRFVLRYSSVALPTSPVSRTFLDASSTLSMSPRSSPKRQHILSS
jgi:hypothetical protein